MSHPQASSSSIRPWIRKEIETFEAPLRRDRGLPTSQVEFKARTRIQQYLKPPKNPQYMEIAIGWMQRIRHEDLPQIKAVDFHDVLKVFEIECILNVGEMMAQASLFRDESRWGYQHWRSDIPYKKPEWEGQWVIVRKGQQGMDLSKRAVPELKWAFPTSMEYSYPALSYDVGKPFQKGPDWKNPERDTWMESHIKEQGADTPRRFMPGKES
jgi:succinate dehydrogenase/fumarate reductase flavoprotein subunit